MKPGIVIRCEMEGDIDEITGVTVAAFNIFRNVPGVGISIGKIAGYDPVQSLP